ncbi:PAS domain S-box protein [Mucilaginibacter sp.]|uniref:PAS domain S-box protein n=1 Tax=Mucilaginibacter sp. TaxID=1882438 RepID=UPI003D0E33E4
MPDKSPSITSDLSFLSGGGEMGQLTRSFNWSENILGPSETWPQSLKTTLSIILNSKFPMFLFWGAQHICFYNDAYRPSLGNNGKHPLLLGASGAEGWQEIWPVIKPLIDQALTGDEATWSEDQLIPIYRNGKMEDVYWTFSYSPVKDESGTPAGVFVACAETTVKVLSLKSLEENNKQLRLSMEAEALSQRKVKENERNLRLIILQAPVAIAIFKGPDHVVEIANSRALELWGRSFNTVANKPILEAMPELQLQGIQQLLNEVYQTGKPYSAEEMPVQLLRQGKLETAYINFVYEALFDLNGKINGLITIGVDVTDQFLARKKIEESEERFRIMAEGTDVMIAVGNEASNAIYFNKAWADMTGRSVADLLSIGWVDLVHPDDRERYVNIYLSAFRNKVPFTGEFRVLSKNGDYRWLLAKGPPRFHPDGSFAGYISSCIDITEQKKADEDRLMLIAELQAINEEMVVANEELAATNEELAETQQSLQKMFAALIESETNFRNMILQAPVAMGLFNGDDMVLEVINDKFLELWDKDRSVIGQPILKALPELEGQPYLQIMKDVLQSGTTYYGSEAKVILHRQGRHDEGYYNFINQSFKDSEGKMSGIIVVANEVTEQVNARKDVERAEETLRLALEAANLGTWFIHSETKELKTTVKLRELFGYDPDKEMTYDEAIGQVTDEYRDKIITDIENAINNGGTYDITYTMHRFDDNRLIWLRSVGKLTRDDDGKLTTFSGVVMDITEQKIDEQRKSDFIGMVSHELKTPLTSLTAIVQVLNTKLKNNENAFIAGAMDKAGIQVKKMSNMINGFLNISRLESGKILIAKQKFDLNNLINEMIDEIRLTSAAHSISLSVCDPIEIFADRDKIGSVISNLLSNAVKYSPKGKQVAINCKITGRFVQVSIKDEGMGIKQSDLDKVFLRYYRVESKHTSHISGFGIGLYLSAEIIERHNGKIWAESENGVGSTFYFTLPVEG